jgi:hypothetical protein
MEWKRELGAGIFLVVSLTIMALVGWGFHQRNLREKAETAYIEQTVELEGAKRALLAKPKEIVKFVTLPPAMQKAVKQGRVTPIAAAKIGATSGTVTVPCPEPVRSTDESFTKGNNLKADIPTTATSTEITFGLTGELFIGKVKGGAVEYTSNFKATVWSNDGWSSDVPFAPENVVFDVKVSTDIAKAIEVYEKPWAAKHLKFMCPGIFVGYNGELTGGVGCGFGVVW